MNFSRVIASAPTATLARMMSSGANHQAPKKIHGHVGRYAMATYTAASKVSPGFVKKNWIHHFGNSKNYFLHTIITFPAKE